MTQNLITRSGTPISKFCFGAMQFGDKADETNSRQMFEACRGAGINYYDTAFSYTEGRSETILGKLAKAEREDLFIATKCAGDIATKDNIHKQFDESRRRLDMDYVDILYIHMWDGNTPLEETFETLAQLVEQGKTRHIAVSNYSAWQVMKAQYVAKSFGVEIAMLQPMYNLVKRQVEVEILPMALSEGFEVCPYSPLGGGLLTGKYASGDTGRIHSNKMYASRYSQEWMHAAAQELSGIAAEIGCHPATLAVAWVARNPAITAPIISARSAEQLRSSLDALTFEMDDAIYDRVTALSPKPVPATDRTEE